MPAVSDCVRVTARSVSTWNEAAPVWKSLAAESPHASFFLSYEWVDCWMAVFGAALRPEIIVFEERGEPAGICMLVRRVVKHGPLPVRRLYLNTDGEDEADETVPEYNSVLCRAGFETAVAQALAGFLLGKRGWDEFVARRLAPGPVERALRCAFATLAIESSAEPAPFVDLERVRRSGAPFEDLLGYATRKHLRQNVRQYSRTGDLRVETANTYGDAMRFFDELAMIHQRSWAARGQPGAFASTRFTAFHRELIARLLPAGRVSLIRVSAGNRTIGILYGFVFDGVLHHYQSGCRYPEDYRLSPGTVTLSQAIQCCAGRSDLRRFDFMAGGSPYKQWLSTGSASVVSLVIRRPTLRCLLMHILKHARAAARNGRKRVALHAR